MNTLRFADIRNVLRIKKILNITKWTTFLSLREQLKTGMESVEEIAPFCLRISRLCDHLISSEHHIFVT